MGSVGDLDDSKSFVSSFTDLILRQETDLSTYDDKELTRVYMEIKDKTMSMVNEQLMYERFCKKHDISIDKQEEPQVDTTRPQSKAAKRKFRMHERRAKLNLAQKIIIMTSEAEELRNDYDRLVKEFNKITATYVAIYEEAVKRTEEIKKSQYEFDRDVIRGGYNERIRTTSGEAVQKYFQNRLRQRDTLYDKLQLSNASLKHRIHRLQSMMQQKEEMGEVLHAVDFEQLKIENMQYLARIDEKNQELLKLKLQSGKITQILNFHKNKLKIAQQANDLLKTDLSQWKELTTRIEKEMIEAENEVSKTARRNQVLKQRLANYRVPSVKEYLSVVVAEQDLSRKQSNVKRKFDIAQLSYKQQQEAWIKLRKQRTTQ